MERTNNAFVTVITNMNYFKGLKVLVKSMRQVKSTIPLYVVIPATASLELKNAVKKLGVQILESEHIQLDDNVIRSNGQQYWNETFFKLNIVKLTQFDKVIYIDADMIVMQNLDHLFTWPSISATTGGKAAHPEWVEFNSGLMVIKPDEELFHRLLDAIPSAILRKQSMGLGFGDQDVFNEVYPEWATLDGHNFGETYNAEICFLDALMEQLESKNLADIKVLHYIGYPKIWNNSLLKNLRILHGCYAEKRYMQAKAWLLYLKYLYL